MDPVAPIEPDEPVSLDAYEAMMAAMDDLIEDGDEPPSVPVRETRRIRRRVEEAFNVNQPRFPRGHAKAGQWRPKLVTGAGGVAPGHLERDIAKLTDLIAQATRYGPGGVGGHHIDAIGQQVEHTALKYSARKTYEKRLADIRAERTRIQTAKWDAYEKAWRAASPPEALAMEPEHFIGPESARRLEEISNEELGLIKQRDFADRDAMLGVLKRIRPMGGRLNTASENTMDPTDDTLQAEYRKQELERQAGTKVLMQRDLEENLKAILKVVPKAWLEDTNAKGEVSFQFSGNRAWADTRTIPTAAPDEWAGARSEFGALTDAGYEFLGRDRQVRTFLALREPNSGDVIALRQDGEIVKGIGDFADTPLVLNAEGEWSLRLPGTDFADPTEADLKRHIEPMKTLPPEHVLASPTSAMGPNWDPYEEVRAAVAQREREGWTYVGRRGMWATLRRGEEEISLNWAGEPLTEQVGPPDKRGLPPLNPHLTIPLAPLPPRTNTQIRIDPRPQDKNTLLHELSHRLEVAYGQENAAGYKPIAMATRRFLDDRTQGEALQKLKDLYPGTAYEDHELARSDRFVDAYVGKQYGGQATEVLTMGMEMLWFPRYGSRDINEDPGHRRLILGILAAL